MKICEKFLREQDLISADEEFFTSNPHPDAPAFIVAWIMHKCGCFSLSTISLLTNISCDDVGLDGKPKDSSIIRDSYSHAQKMRAAATYGFKRCAGLGSAIWQRSEVTGKMVGNPSVSEAVSRYMVSLRKRKVCRS